MITIKHLMFAWDLFRKFCDSLKIAKFNTRERDFFFFLNAKKLHLHVPSLLSILAIINISTDRVLSDKYGKRCFSFFDYSTTSNNYYRIKRQKAIMIFFTVH